MAAPSPSAAKHLEDDLFQNPPPQGDLFQDPLQDDLFQEPPPQHPPKPRRPHKEPPRGGYSCEFVGRPPIEGVEQDDGICPVCSLVLREPHQVTCCGYTLCQSCIQAIQKEQSQLCPSCNQEFTAFADKRLKRSLHARKVYCSQRGAGCEWVGKLGELDEHLNLQPLPEKLLEGCPFSEIECSYCMQPFQRCYVQDHQSENCPKRPYTCQHCKKYAATYEEVTQNHWPVCPFFPLSCPNNCELVLQRQELENHVNHDCPLTLVDCDFHTVGCQTRLARKDLQSHIGENLMEHVYLQQKMIVDLQNMVERYKNENKQLQEALSASYQKLEAKLTEHKQMLEEMTYTGTLPVEFTMTEFEQHKRVGDDWYSPPFYTHTHGYRMRVVVSANGRVSGRGTHVSVTPCLMQGDFDDNLQWPFEGSITIQLLNQIEDCSHHTNVQNYGQFSDPRKGGRVTSGESAPAGPCLDTFISHTQLAFDSHRNVLYLRNNKLKFRISKATKLDATARMYNRCLTLESFAGVIEPQVCVAPIEFMLSEFEEQKKQDDVWYSPAFYTRPRGYRMCLRVDPNGYGDERGTHISIFACMMRGRFDASLKWPFQGNITIQIINQVGDVNHYQRSIPFTNETQSSDVGRLTDRERSGGVGFSQFIAHSSLDYDASMDTQYLRANCLRIRILKVK